MQFLILAKDATDDGALERRMKTREAHLKIIEKYRKSGNMMIGAARLNDAGKMIGSVIVADFPSRKELDAWLAEEPFVQDKVWGEIQIEACSVGPSFVKSSS